MAKQKEVEITDELVISVLRSYMEGENVKDISVKFRVRASIIYYWIKKTGVSRG